MCLFVVLTLCFAVDGNLFAAKVKTVNGSGNFYFAVTGDRNGGERKGVFTKKAVTCLNLLAPEFVVNVGDNIRGYNEDINEVNKQWDKFDDSLKGLQMPFYRTIGNHDITNKAMAELYQKRYGQSYHYMVYKNVLFLFVSTEDPYAKEPADVKKQQDDEMSALRAKIKKEGYTEENIRHLDDYEIRCDNLRGGKITDQQVKYFEKVLKDNAKVRWTFVIMHKPVYNETNPPANWLKIEKMLETRPYTVFTGHTHRNAYLSRNGRDYITMSTTGGGWGYPPTSTGVYDHILFVKMTDKGPSIANILLDAVFDPNDVRAVKVEEYSAAK
jgi:serine/threonine-protein phosphatase CPPED1